MCHLLGMRLPTRNTALFLCARHMVGAWSMPTPSIFLSVFICRAFGAAQFYWQVSLGKQHLASSVRSFVFLVSQARLGRGLTPLVLL